MAPDDDKAQVEMARREAEAALPPGWKLGKTDLEIFRGPKVKLWTYSACAEGPGGAGALAIGLSQAAAYHHLARRLRGELDETDGWAPPLPPPGR